MPIDVESRKDRAADEFARLCEERRPGLLREFGEFLVDNKKWWLAPIVIVLLAVGLLATVDGAALPFIYALF